MQKITVGFRNIYKCFAEMKLQLMRLVSLSGWRMARQHARSMAEVFKSVTLNVAQPSSVLWRTKLCKQCNERIRHIPTFRTDNVPSY